MFLLLAPSFLLLLDICIFQICQNLDTLVIGYLSESARAIMKKLHYFPLWFVSLSHP